MDSQVISEKIMNKILAYSEKHHKHFYCSRVRGDSIQMTFSKAGNWEHVDSVLNLLEKINTKNFNYKCGLKYNR